ncbi:hypothetical protein D1623_28820 [Klebsiella pneumoniae]|nr:hypothetical protein D1623_28820 [Klebsiella pneumoniae]
MARLFGVFDMRIDETAAMMTAMGLFVSAIAFGAYLQNVITKEEPTVLNVDKLVSLRMLAAVGLYLSLPVVLIVLSIVFGADDIITTRPTELWLLGNLLYVSSIVVGLSHWPKVFSLYVALCMVLLSHVFNGAPIHRNNPPNISAQFSFTVALASAVICGCIVVTFAPARAVVWRLTMIMCGVATLAALNVLSLLAIKIPTPPI